MKEPIKLNQKLIDQMVNERYWIVEREGYKFKKVMKLRIAYEKELKEKMQRQEMQEEEVSFDYGKSGKFLLLAMIGVLLFATIVVNAISKVSGCGFTWQPKPQKCIRLVK